MKKYFFLIFSFCCISICGAIETFAQSLDSLVIKNPCTTEYYMNDGSVVVVFKCNTTWLPPTGLVELEGALVIAGGGGGGRRDTDISRGGGGGGAGGAVYVTNPVNLTLNDLPLNITIGSGGLGATATNRRGNMGVNSSIETAQFPHIISEGGGGGGSALTGSDFDGLQRNGGNGGSGGGGTSRTGIGGNSSAGNRGGNGTGNINDNVTGGGGGGGAGGQGLEPQGATNGGAGGPGRIYPITNGLPIIVASAPQNIFAAGGGGVGGNPGGQGGALPGGSGIGGNGNNTQASGATGAGGNGLINTGSGGGVGFSRGGNGSSGIVIIRFLSSRILPVEFLNFEIKFLDQIFSSVISWYTAKEWENSHFEIERSELNIKNFEKIGQVKGMGWTETITSYSFEDKNLPLSGGLVYYRLKQIDFSGKFEYSSVVSVNLPKIHVTQGVWRAYPNPTVNDQLRVSLLDRNGYNDEALTFRLIQANSVSESMTVSTEEEMNEILAGWVPRMSRGLFVVEIRWGQKVEHIKVLRK
ncbi:glycine-rich domain-containing protein [Aquiflexum sp.]|uniref:glycine-rich domain-containing protein n=1 Tax=Aquiflexum sp. TaxID=1872584 RepID=UPI0035941825